MTKPLTHAEVLEIRKVLENLPPGPWYADRFVDLIQVRDKHGSTIANRKETLKFLGDSRTTVESLARDLDAVMLALKHQHALLNKLRGHYKWAEDEDRIGSEQAATLCANYFGEVSDG